LSGLDIHAFKDIHRGETCVILGNGPSLNAVDVTNLPYKVFGSNRIYLKAGARVDYYACVNPLVLEQFGAEIRDFQATKFLNAEWAAQLGGVTIDTSLGAPLFAQPDGPIWEGHTVTYVLLQLAYWMGFGRAILLGVDHDYGQHARRPNLELVASGPDAHHFDPNYFAGGARWHAPDLSRSELAYSLAKHAWEADGREIVNASARTKLTVFPLTSYRRALYGGPRVSAIVSAYHCPEQWVRDTVADLRSQTEPVEIVVVMRKDDPLNLSGLGDVVVTTPDTPSVYRAWNLGIQAAHGKYITNANTDDRRHPLSLQTLADVLDARPELDVVYHDQYVTWDEPQTYAEFVQALDAPLAPGREEGRPGVMVWAEHDLATLGQGCYLGPQPMWRASLHQRYGYFTEDYRSAGDYEFWLRVATETNMAHVGAALGVYCARMDGVELGDPARGLEEAQRALMMTQDPDGIRYTPQGRVIRLDLGGRRAYVEAGEFFRVIDQLRGRYA
jgi:hypothetical protein